MFEKVSDNDDDDDDDVSKCEERRCNLGRGASDAAVASGAHGGGLD